MDYAGALVEHPMWAWHIGMVAERGARVYDIGKGFAGYEVPDINHPATKGWLLHMLREAVEGHAFCDLESTEPDEWRVNADYLEMDGPWDFPTAPTEGEALAAALLAVWGPV
jgi:hypothetical protein